MGVGKTSVGKRLAKALNLTFCDLDSEISARESMSISEIFETEGEDIFRDLESGLLHSLSGKEMVLSTGGGTPCFYENMDFMLANGLVIWLYARPEIITTRLKTAKQMRPLIAKLMNDEILEFVIKKLKSREPFYKRAHIHFNAANFSSHRLHELVDVVKNYSR